MPAGSGSDSCGVVSVIHTSSFACSRVPVPSSGRRCSRSPSAPIAAGSRTCAFQTRQLSITEQSVAKDRAGAKVSRRGLTLDEHLGQLAHHSAKQRTAACDGAREITTAHGDEAWRCFAPLLDGAARLINDDDGATRRAASKLIRDAILPTAYGPGDAVADENARQAAIVAAAPLFAGLRQHTARGRHRQYGGGRVAGPQRPAGRGHAEEGGEHGARREKTSRLPNAAVLDPTTLLGTTLPQ